MIRVALVDDHRLLRSALARLLELTPEMEVVAVASSGEEFLLVDPQVEIDVVLMDLSMPGMGGVEATRRSRRLRPEARVVILSAHTDRAGIDAAMEAGAFGYLVKDAEPSELVAGIRSASQAEPAPEASPAQVPGT